jgi:hypothetical protein
MDITNVVPTLKYLGATIRHKYFVYRAGRWTGASTWRLLKHDWTKFSCAEAPHYGRRFYGSNDDPDGFDRAWNHHSKANDHHWEYWIPITTHTLSKTAPGEPLAMSEAAVREMVADWMGAGRAYKGAWPHENGPDDWPWWNDNKDKMRLHPDTRILVEAVIAETYTRRKENP